MVGLASISYLIVLNAPSPSFIEFCAGVICMGFVCGAIASLLYLIKNLIDLIVFRLKGDT